MVNTLTKQLKLKTSPQRKNTLREIIEAIGFPITAALVLIIFVVQAFRIPTGSMKDTLLIGDFLLVNKFIYGTRTPDHIPLLDIPLPHVRLPGFKNPSPGEIVVFKYPKDEKLDYIKRCMAVGGQIIELRDREVFIDGQPEGKRTFIKKEYDPEEGQFINYYRIETPHGFVYTIRQSANQFVPYEDYGPTTVPEGHYFMMGDNRDNSADSRSWGFVPADNIVGQAMVIYWSWDKSVSLTNFFSKVRWTRIGNLIK